MLTIGEGRSSEEQGLGAAQHQEVQGPEAAQRGGAPEEHSVAYTRQRARSHEDACRDSCRAMAAPEETTRARPYAPKDPIAMSTMAEIWQGCDL